MKKYIVKKKNSMCSQGINAKTKAQDTEIQALTTECPRNLSCVSDKWVEYDSENEIAMASYVISQKANRTVGTSEEETQEICAMGYNGDACHIVHDVGQDGQGRICLLSGKLNFVYNDLEWNGNRMPINIFHVHNTTAQEAPLIFYPTVYDSNYDSNTSRKVCMSFGKGWKLNYQQYLYKKSNEEYIYCDEYGSEIRFIPKVLEEGEESTAYSYADDNGYGYELDVITRILHKDGLYFIFDPTTCLLQEIQDEYSTLTIQYEDSLTGKSISSIKDGIGRTFSFTYNTDGTLQKITDPAGGVTSYLYTNGCLTSVSHADGRVGGFTYNQYGWIKTAGAKINDEIDGGIQYYYAQESEDETLDDAVIGIVGKTADHTTVDMRITYNDVVVINNPYSGVVEFESYYRLDGNGAILYAYVKQNESVVAADISEKYDNGIGESSQISRYCVDNLFNGEDIEWYRGDEACSEAYSNESVFGRSYVLTSISKSVPTGIRKIVSLEAQTEYTVSAYVKLETALTTSGGGVHIRVADICDDNSQLDYCYSSYVRDVTNGFVRIDYTFKTSIAKDYEINFEIENATGTALINAIQIEKGICSSPLNILADGSFERLNTSDVWNNASNGVASVLTSSLNGKCVKFTPDPNDEAMCLSQTLAITSSASKLETFQLSGFANLSNAVEDGNILITAGIFYESDEVETTPHESYAVKFDPAITGWQYNSVVFEKNAYRKISKIVVVLQSNVEVSFDEIQLTMLSSREVTANYFNKDISDDDSASESGIFANGKIDEFGNSLGNVVSDGANAFFTSSYYSENGNDLTEQSDERLNKTLYEVKATTSQVETESAPCRSTIYYEYYAGSNNLKSVSTSITGEEIKTEYAYENGNLTEISAPTANYDISYEKGNVESINVSGVSDPLVSYTYNTNSGRIKTASYPNGSLMTCTYDAFGRVISEVWTNGMETEAEYKYGYDHEGNLIRSIDLTRGVMYLYRYKNGQVVESRERKLKKNSAGVWCRVDMSNYDSSYGYIHSSDGVTTPQGNRIRESKDELDRITRREIRLGTNLLAQNYEYATGAFDTACFVNAQGLSPTTNLISKISYHNNNSQQYSLNYEYDASGNISQIKRDDTVIARYGYDLLGRLVREDNLDSNKTVLYTYDKGGNILTKTKYAFTLNSTPLGTSTISTYTYDSVWKDRLTKYSGYGDTMAYVGGNPNCYNGYTLLWEKGRQLKSMSKTDNLLSFEYNASGFRTRKLVNGVAHNYHLNGLNVLLETIENGTNVDFIQYLYDNNNEICGLEYNGETFYYVKNLQKDIIAIVDSMGETVVKYVYDAWGKVEAVTDGYGIDVSELSLHIGNINPFRYRSYYYDIETKLYYLQSRYYDPEVCRFINSDDAFLIGLYGHFEYNLYSYCANNPASNVDVAGNLTEGIIYSQLLYAYSGLKASQITLNTMIKKAYLAAGSLIRLLIVVGVIALSIVAILLLTKEVEKIINAAKELDDKDQNNYNKSKNCYYVYILKRLSDKKIFYVGITNDIHIRMKHHKNSGKPPFRVFLAYETPKKGTARVMEQLLINSLNLIELSIDGSNKIRSIAKIFSNRIKYKEGIADIAALLYNQIESNVLLAMGM